MQGHESDYINASYIEIGWKWIHTYTKTRVLSYLTHPCEIKFTSLTQGYSVPKKFIATQDIGDTILSYDIVYTCIAKSVL